MMGSMAAVLMALWSVAPAVAPPEASPSDRTAAPSDAPTDAEAPPGSAAAPPGGAPSVAGSRVVVKLQGGHDMAGTVVSLDDSQLVLELPGGARVTLALSQVVSMTEISALDPPLPTTSSTAPAPPPPPVVVYRRLRDVEVIPSHRTRYFYAPSAMTLREGEGYFSQKEVVFSAAAFGATDHLSVLLGSFLPATLFGGVDGLNGIVALKYGWEVAPKVHVALAAEAVASQFGAFGLGGGILTYGDPHNHVTLVAAYPFAFQGGQFEPGDASLFALAGTLRTGRRWALLSENWLITGVTDGEPSESLMVWSFGMRRFGIDHAFDLALVGFSGLGGMFPWFDWTFSWGQREPDGRRVDLSSKNMPAGGLPPGFAGWQRGRAEVGLR